MRRLVPEHLDLPLEDLYAGLTLGEDAPAAPWLAVGMVSSVDGGATVAGRTDTLGGEADSVAFRRLRDGCDAILVGAGTVRAEGYGPPLGTAPRRDDRRRRGLAAVPRLVIVSGTLELDPGHRVFADRDHRPLIATAGDAPEAARRSLEPVAEILACGREAVDLPVLLGHLSTLGLDRVLCEGGPTLNAGLLAAGLVDELFVTLTPLVLSGDAPRIVQQPGPVVPREMVLRSVHEHEGELLLRYRRPGAEPGR